MLFKLFARDKAVYACPQVKIFSPKSISKASIVIPCDLCIDKAYDTFNGI